MKKTILLLSLVLLSNNVYASIDTNLKYGQKSNEVSKLQEFLADKGFLTTSPSGFFGLLTFKAVKTYQVSQKLPPTGFVGSVTRLAINKEINAEVKQEVKKDSVVDTKKVEAPTPVPTVNSVSDDGIGFVFPDGVKALSPLKINGFYQEVIKAERKGKEGEYNRFTKVFESYEDRKKRDDAYQKSIVINVSDAPLQKSLNIPDFDFHGEPIPMMGLRDTSGSLHTVICAYANADIGVTDVQVKNVLKKLLDDAPIFSTTEATKNVNVTKMVDSSIYDEPGMVYKKVIVCGVITNKNGQKNYVYRLTDH